MDRQLIRRPELLFGSASCNSTKIIACSGRIDQQQQRGHRAVKVADRQRWTRQRTGVRELETVCFNWDAGVGVAVENNVAIYICICTGMKAVNVRAAMERVVQMDLKQLDNCTWIELGQLSYRSNRRPDTGVVCDRAANVCWPVGSDDAEVPAVVPEKQTGCLICCGASDVANRKCGTSGPSCYCHYGSKTWRNVA